MAGFPHPLFLLMSTQTNGRPPHFPLLSTVTLPWKQRFVIHISLSCPHLCAGSIRMAFPFKCRGNKTAYRKCHLHCLSRSVTSESPKIKIKQYCFDIKSHVMVNQKNTIGDCRVRWMETLFINTETLQHTHVRAHCVHSHTSVCYWYINYNFTVYVCNSSLQWENQENRIIKLFTPFNSSLNY